MQITVLNEDFEIIGIIGVFTSLQWNRKYYEPGTFQLDVPASYFPILNAGKYICRNDRDELGVIQVANYKKDDNGSQEARCKGTFAECLLNYRVIPLTFAMTGTPEDIGRKLVDMLAIHPSNTDRVLPNVRLGEKSGIGESLSFQSTGDALGDTLYSLETTQEASHRLAYDYLDNSLTYEVWKGKNRTDTQTENSWAVFSDSFYNVKNVEYYRDNTNYYNVAYVAGEGTGASRTVVEVDLRTSGEKDRRELYVDARDLRKEYKDSNGADKVYTDDQYIALLRQRGIEKLCEYALVETAGSDIDANANLIYRKDFDLGDLCTYRNSSMNMDFKLRITEIDEVYEGAEAKLGIVLGTNNLSTLSKIIKREVR